MSVSHASLARLDAAPAAPPPRLASRDRPLIRLPSYKELTSQCGADAAGAPPPSSARSSLFTAGLIHLPPLKVPNGNENAGPVASGSGSGSKSKGGYTSSPPRRQPGHHHKDEDPPAKHRYLDLAGHCPAPPPPQRGGSPYSSASASTDRDSPDDPRGLTLPPHPHAHHVHPQTQGHHQQAQAHAWPPSATSVPLPTPYHSSSAHYPASSPSSSASPYAANSSIHNPPYGASSPYANGPSSPYTTGASSPYTNGASSPYTNAAYGSGSTPYGLEPKLKFSHAKAGGRTKKQALSCFFCRERKIACGRPEEGGDGACNQCARRKIPCTYPTVSHRGQHSRIKSAARKAGGAYAGGDGGVGDVGVRGDEAMEGVDNGRAS
ncbi:hypothetical protein FB451DRAFT_762905 [Mycena latifolia]|nr:hypothetical protein FB451DRAFT_762905 [Mycena latifolia]